MRTIALSILFVAISAPMAGQQGCALELKQLINGSLKVDSGAVEGAIRTKFVVKTSPGDGGVAANEQFSLAAGKGRSIMENELLHVYEDSEARVVVLPKDSMVYIYDQVKNVEDLHQAQWDRNMALIYEVGEVRDCRTIARDVGLHFEIEYTFSPDPKSSMIKELKLVYDKTRKKPIRIDAIYYPGQSMKSQSVKYSSFQPGSFDPRLKRRSVDLVWDGKELLGITKGFTLRDLRQKHYDHAQP